MDIDTSQLALVLIFLGSYAATEICKRLFGTGDYLAWVNTAVAGGIGAGLALISEGAPLERVIVAAAAAVVSGVSAAGIHRVADALRAYKEWRV